MQNAETNGQTTEWTDEPEFHLPKDHWPLPELSHTTKHHVDTAKIDFVAAQESEQYTALRTSFTSFAFPMVAIFIGLYFVFVLMAVYAPSFMGRKVFGNINIGIIFGLLNFATTYFVTWAYVRHANKNLDPMSTSLREQLEAGTK
ncbi:MAG TPA: DUF485 domain-containing protein [Propionibacteriaceae bacterium]|nr:DUF485 domain-containing protein [Propionibacteriaceae bacterium]